jgi:hypothetical protein
MDIWLELVKLWLVGIVFSFMINIFDMYITGKMSIARWTFNVMMWPLAILILCVKGGLEHLHKRKS